MADFSIDQKKLPGVKEVCRDFAVLEDHTLAHSLQEQEIESHLASNIHKSRLVQQDLQVAKRLQEEEDLRAKARIQRKHKDIERSDNEIAQEIQEQLVRQAEQLRQQEEKDEAIARKLHEREMKEERRRQKQLEASIEEDFYDDKGAFRRPLDASKYLEDEPAPAGQGWLPQPASPDSGKGRYPERYPSDSSRDGYPERYPSDSSRDGYPERYPSDSSRDGYPERYPSDSSRDGYPERYPSDSTRGKYPKDYPKDSSRARYPEHYPTDSSKGRYPEHFPTEPSRGQHPIYDTPRPSQDKYPDHGSLEPSKGREGNYPKNELADPRNIHTSPDLLAEATGGLDFHIGSQELWKEPDPPDPERVVRRKERPPEYHLHTREKVSERELERERGRDQRKEMEREWQREKDLERARDRNVERQKERHKAKDGYKEKSRDRHLDGDESRERLRDMEGSRERLRDIEGIRDRHRHRDREGSRERHKDLEGSRERPRHRDREGSRERHRHREASRERRKDRDRDRDRDNRHRDVGSSRDSRKDRDKSKDRGLEDFGQNPWRVWSGEDWDESRGRQRAYTGPDEVFEEPGSRARRRGEKREPNKEVTRARSHSRERGRKVRGEFELREATQGISRLDLREQELRDMEVARRLQEEELKESQMDIRAAQVAQDEEMARLLMEEDKKMYKKSREREKPGMERRRPEGDSKVELVDLPQAATTADVKGEEGVHVSPPVQPAPDEVVRPRSQEDHEYQRPRNHRPARSTPRTPNYENVDSGYAYPASAYDAHPSSRPETAYKGSYYRQ